MAVNNGEALVAKGAIVVAWSLFALTIAVGFQAGVNADAQRHIEPVKVEASRQP